MSFPRYSEYKKSGVEWLGDVPKHWQTIRLKRLVDLVTDKASTTTRQVGLENIEGWTGRFIDTESEFAGDGIQFNAGDILFGKLRPYLAKVYLSDLPGEAVGDFFVIRPRKVNRQFLQKYILSPAVINDLDASTIGAKMPRVSWEDMGLLTIATPTNEEQTTIAAFLDHETAKIDALIQEQQRLIELLKEKRQAVISHAVTKGLDLSVPMKDSGVEWLGEVPAHWIIVNLKRIVVFQRGHDLPTDSRGSGTFPVVSSGGYSGTHNVSCAKAPGIVTGRYGSIGQFILVEEDYWPLNTAMYSMELYDNTPRYVWYLLHAYREHFLLNSLKSAVPGVDRNDIHVVKVVRAPVGEQETIVEYLDVNCGRIDILTAESQKNIELLNERRSALISAAVTGKIDVRNWKPPVDESAFDEKVRKVGLEAVS